MKRIAARVLLALIIFEGALRGAGMLLVWRQRHRDIPSSGIRVLAIGASTTQGMRGASYPEELEKILKSRLGETPVTVINEGLAGQNSYDVTNHLEGLLDTYRPQFVLTMLGNNDSPHCQKEEPAPQRLVNSLHVVRFLRILFNGKLEPGATPVRAPAAPRQGTESAEAFYAWVMRGNEPKGPLSYTASILTPLGKAGRSADAVRMMEDICHKYPGQPYAWAALGNAYAMTDKKAALRAHQKAFELAPRNPWILSELARAYNQARKYPEEIRTLEALVKLDPQNSFYVNLLADGFFRQRKLAERERLLRGFVDERGEAADPATVRALILSMRLSGHDATPYERLLSRLHDEEVPPCTAANYRWIAETVQSRGITLVAVQYPMRSIQPLREALGNLESGEPLFVENRDCFEKELRANHDRQVFTDHFAGDFGHCTRYGYSLIAQNVAEAILPVIRGSGS